MGTMDWTAIVVGLFTLLGGCAWFVEGRKYRQQVKGLAADNRMKDLELGVEFVKKFNEHIAGPLLKEVGDLRSEIGELRDAIRKVNDCTYRDKCPVRDELRRKPESEL